LTRRPLEFGVNLNNREPLIAPDYDLNMLLDLSAEVEERGFDSVWLGDSLFSKPRYEPISLLSAISQRTSRVKLGTSCMVSSTRNPLYNEALSKIVQKSLDRVGAPKWDAADTALAKAIQKEVGVPETGLSDAVLPWAPGRGSGASSDVGEVSAAVPLAELAVQTGPNGVPWHHWDVASCAAHPMGLKGMFVAAKVLASSMMDLLQDQGTIAAAKAELQKTTAGKPYVSPLAPDAKPKTY